MIHAANPGQMLLTLRAIALPLLCLLIVASWPIATINAQIRCATTEQTQALFDRIQKQEKKEIFERAIEQKSIARLQANGQQRTQTGPYQIPVVAPIFLMSRFFLRYEC